MSDAYYRERCAILEKEVQQLRDELRHYKGQYQQQQRDLCKCEGDLYICDRCRPGYKKPYIEHF